MKATCLDDNEKDLEYLKQDQVGEHMMFTRYCA